MTTAIEDVKALLDGLGAAGGAHYAANVDDPDVFPFITFQRVVSVPNVSLSGPSAMQPTRWQFDFHAKTIQTADALASAFKTAIQASGLTNIPLSGQDIYDPEAGLHRVSLDYSIWATN